MIDKFLYVVFLTLFCLTYSCQHKTLPTQENYGFTGSWKLESWTAILSDGTKVFPFGEKAYGKLIYEANGEMSGIFMAENRELMSTTRPSERSPEEALKAFNSFFAYAGPYEVYIDSGFVKHTVEACSNPNWIGNKQKRYFRFEKERLILTTPPIEVTGTQSQAVQQILVWQKIGIHHP